MLTPRGVKVVEVSVIWLLVMVTDPLVAVILVAVGVVVVVAATNTGTEKIATAKSVVLPLTTTKDNP